MQKSSQKEVKEGYIGIKMQFYITINSGKEVLSVIVLMREGQLVNVPLGDLLDGISALCYKLERYLKGFE